MISQVQQATIAQASSVSGEVFVVREGEPPQKLSSGMEIKSGDVLRAGAGGLAIVSIPGTVGQIASLLEISNNAEAKLSLDAPGEQGRVTVQRLSDPAEGTLYLEHDMQGENQAAYLEGESGEEGMSGLVGMGLGAGFLGAAGALGPAAAGAAALFAVDDLQNGDDTPVDNPTGSNPILTPADTAGGVVGTVENLSENLDNLTEPVPVIGQLVDTLTDILAGNGGAPSLIPPLVGGLTATILDVTNQLVASTDGIPLIGELTGVLDSVLQGSNDGGISGVLSGLGSGLDSALGSTPLAPLGDVLDGILNGAGGLIPLGPLDGGLSGGLETLGDAIEGFGTGTPAEPLADLLADLIGTSGTAQPVGVEGLNLGGDLPLLGDLPLVGDLLGTVTSIASTGLVGGDAGALPFDLSALTQTLG